MVELPDYTLDGADGPVRLVDVFEGKRQLIVYNHMWFPGEEWQCPGCTGFTSQFTRLEFLDNYDARFVIVTQGPIDEALAYKARVGNKMTWYSTANSSFGADMGAPPGGGFQVNVFLRVGDTVYRTYNTQGRGTEQLSHTLRPDRPAALRTPGGVAGLAGGLAAVAHVQPLGSVGGVRPLRRAGLTRAASGSCTRRREDGTLPEVGDLLLRNVRPWPRQPGSDAIDVVIRDGRIASGPAPAGSAGRRRRRWRAAPGVRRRPRPSRFDASGPALPSAHRRAGAGRADPATIAGTGAAAGGSVEERATRTLGATIASGATAVRSHAQVDTDCGLDRLEGVLAAREAHAERADVQVVAFPQSGILRDPGTADLLDAAVRAGADLVGGLDPCAFDRDPVAHLDVVFGIADRHGVGVDIHLHETGELGAFTIELIAERTVALGMQGSVTISHAFALGSVDASRQAALIELLADRRHRADDGRARQP